MEKTEILASMNKIWRDELDNEAITITESSTANDIEEWDSLSNIQLVVATEKLFKIRFNSAEIAQFKNVGEMIDCIKAKIG